MEIFIVFVTNRRGIQVQASNAYRSLEAAKEVEKTYVTEYGTDHYVSIVSFEVA